MEMTISLLTSKAVRLGGGLFRVPISLYL